MLTTLLAGIGLLLLAVEVAATARMARAHPAWLPPRKRRAAKWFSWLAGLTLATASLAFPTLLGYHLESPSGPYRIVGIPFMVAAFDSHGADYVGPLTLPAALVNAVVWLMLPITLFAAGCWQLERRRLVA